MEHTVLVSNDGLISPGFPCNSSAKHPSVTIQLRSATSTLSENETAGSSFISKSLRHPNIPPEITDVMLCMYRNDCLYSGLCASRSALSSSITTKGHLKLSDHPLISRYLNGIYNRHPPLPKYVNIWDLTLLLKYYEQKESNDCLECQLLVKKAVMLFIILGACRKQALFTLSVDNIVFQRK